MYVASVASIRQLTVDTVAVEVEYRLTQGREQRITRPNTARDRTKLNCRAALSCTQHRHHHHLSIVVCK